jgi:hypothetical protein
MSHYVSPAAALLIVFILGTIITFFITYSVLLPRYTTTKIDIDPRARCDSCGDIVKGCTHAGGVTSTWVHARTGTIWCDETKTTRAMHR